MISRSWRCYGAPFKGSRGVAQGYLLSPTRFNMVVDAVICHLVTVVAGEDTGPEGFGRALQKLVTLF